MRGLGSSRTRNRTKQMASIQATNNLRMKNQHIYVNIYKIAKFCWKTSLVGRIELLSNWKQIFLPENFADLATSENNIENTKMNNESQQQT